MTDDNLDRALEITLKAVVEAGLELKQHYGKVETIVKGSGDSVSGVVTELDGKTEKLLADRLSKFSPDIGFIGEEYGAKTEKDTTWLVDPIDGTAHYIRGMPFCTTMVALVENGQVVMSVIHNFVEDKTYWAIRGKGAYCNNERILVSQRSLRQSFLSFETRLEESYNYERYLTLEKTAHSINFMNSGHEFTMIASGKLEGKIGLNPYGMDWDFAPGSLLVTEAGGVATNIGSDTYNYKNHDFIIANPIVHRELTTGPHALFPS